MNTKIATGKEFTNSWLRTGKDPDGNILSTMICGSNEDSYRQYVLTKLQESSVINKPKHTFDFINAIANGRTLFVGEGNFSFYLSIAWQISNLYNIVAKTNQTQSEFSDLTKQNINSLQKLSVKVFCKTDATEISRDFAGQTFGNYIQV